MAFVVVPHTVLLLPWFIASGAGRVIGSRWSNRYPRNMDGLLDECLAGKLGVSY
jgi:hypothetical protein